MRAQRRSSSLARRRARRSWRPKSACGGARSSLRGGAEDSLVRPWDVARAGGRGRTGLVAGVRARHRSSRHGPDRHPLQRGACRVGESFAQVRKDVLDLGWSDHRSPADGSFNTARSTPRERIRRVDCDACPECGPAYLRAAIRSWVRTVSLPIRLAGSPGAQDHWVPIAAPSAETDTTATERSLPARARRRCSCKRSIIEATPSSAGASETARGKGATLVCLGARLPIFLTPDICFALSEQPSHCGSVNGTQAPCCVQ